MSSTLTIVLGIIAVILIVAGLGAILFRRKSRRSNKASYSVPPARPRSPEQELNELGILEIRPKAASSVQEVRERPAPVEEVEIIDGDSDEEVGGEVNDDQIEETVEKIEEPTPEPSDILAEPVVEEEQSPRRMGVSRRETLFRFLNAVQASVDGFTACLIKRDAEGQCEVEAFVSQHPRSLVNDVFRLDLLFGDAAVLETAVTVMEVGARELSSIALAYYAEPVAVRQVAIAPVKGQGGEHKYYLLVDALAWQDLDDPWQRLMIGQYATLLGTLMTAPISEEGENAYMKPRIRPRREIIAEEMERARAGSYPLALALIYLNGAEEIAMKGEQAIGAAERAMADRLEASVLEGRLERFGELTYGIFREEQVSEVEAWALQLQEELVNDGGCFEGGVSIGIAILQDRHDSPDSFRADATEALREAFETGACTIIE